MSSRAVTLPGLPAFNAGDYHYVIDDVEGWDNGAGISAHLVANGGGDGAVGVGVWTSPERYITVKGSIEVEDRAQIETVRRQLLAAFPFRTSEAVLRRATEPRQWVTEYVPETVPEGAEATAYTTNLIAQPSAEYGVDRWSVYAGTVAQATGFAAVGQASFKLTAAGTDINAILYNAADRIPVTPGVTYTVTARFRAATTARACRVDLSWRTEADTGLASSAGYLVGTSVRDDVDGWTTITTTSVAPAGAEYLVAYCGVFDSPAAGEVHYVDAVIATEGAVQPAYFDGDTPDDTRYHYEWTGEPGASPSRRGRMVRKVNVVTSPELIMFARRYDVAEIEMTGHIVTFSLPLVAADPWKYGAQTLTGSVGAYTGDSWYRTYQPSTDGSGAPVSPWYRRYVFEAGVWVRRYVQDQPMSARPESVTFTSDGTVVSDRVTVEVSGPLEAGDWYLVNESTGEQMSADVGLIEGQSLLFDCHTKTLTLNGTPVPELFLGDWLTLAPGTSVFRLRTGRASDGYATFTALPAFE